MARRYDHRRVKIHHPYTIPEIVRLLGVSKLTVSRWIARGLPLVERKRPYLIHGSDVRAFLSAIMPKPQPCGPGEIYCVGCRAPRRPAADMVDYLPRNVKVGVLRGICLTCDRLMHRAVNVGKLDIVAHGLSVSRPAAQQRIADSRDPIPNVAEKGEKI